MIQKLQTLVSKSLLMLFVATVSMVTVAAIDATLFKSSLVAFAEQEQGEIEDTIEDLEAKKFQGVDYKWEVTFELTDDGDDEKFYIYNIKDEDDLFDEIADHLESEYDLGYSEEEVESILVYDEDAFDGQGEMEELEIEAEPYKSVEGKWKVEAEVNGEEVKFYVYEIDNDEELVSEITKYLNDKFDANLTESEVKEVIEIEREEDDDEDEKEDKEKGYEKEKTNNGKGLSLGNNLNIDLNTATKEEKEAFIEDLRDMLMQLLMQLLEQVKGNK